MLKLPFFRKTPRLEKHFLGLDLGSDFVKALIFEISKEGEISIIGKGVHPQGLSDMHSGAVADIGAVSENAESAINEASLNCGIKPKQAIVGLSGEAVKNLLTTVRLSRKDAKKPLEEKELSDLATRVKEAAFSEAEKEMAQICGNGDLEIEIISSELINARVDGFSVSELLGFEGKTLELCLFTAFSPVIHLATLSAVVKNLGLALLACSSQMYTLSKVLSPPPPQEFDALIFDIGGEETDIAVVFGGGVSSSRTLNLGGRIFTKAIGESFGLPFAEAEEKKLSFSKGKLSDEEWAKVKDCLKEPLSLWQRGVEVALSDFEGVKTFPGKIFLAGGGASLPGILDTLSSYPWTRNFPFPHFPRFELLEPSILAGQIKDKTGKILQTQDVNPASLGVIAREFLPKEVESVRAFFKTRR